MYINPENNSLLFQIISFDNFFNLKNEDNPEKDYSEKNLSSIIFKIYQYYQYNPVVEPAQYRRICRNRQKNQSSRSYQFHKLTSVIVFRINAGYQRVKDQRRLITHSFCGQCLGFLTICKWSLLPQKNLSSRWVKNSDTHCNG